MVALAEWQKRCGADELETLRTTLLQAAHEYKSLAEDERASVNKYHLTRREHQLNAFLDDFEIRDAKIKGIGPAKEAALKSYGVETAADVTLQKLLSVPGFGSATSLPLLAWRQKLEGRFVFRARLDDTDQQEIARIRSAIHSRGSTLRRTLMAGPSHVKALHDRVKKATEITDQVLTGRYLERERAMSDLKLLGVAIPQVTSALSSASPTRSIGVSVPRPLPVSAIPHCPRCGSVMVSRTARRGLRFWGCSRYPQCKGTRNP